MLNARTIVDTLLEAHPKEVLARMFQPSTLEFTSEYGVPWLAEFVLPRQPTAIANKLNELPEPLVQFYDRRYTHLPPKGRFVGSFYATTLLDHGPNSLNFYDKDVTDWWLDPRSMQKIIDWIYKLWPAIAPQ